VQISHPLAADGIPEKFNTASGRRSTVLAAAGNYVRDLGIARIGNKEGFVLCDMDGMPLLKGNVSTGGLELQRSADGAEDLFIPGTGPHKPPFVPMFDEAVDEIAGVGMEILVTENVLAARRASETLQVE
jgi:hypothetical protein